MCNSFSGKKELTTPPKNFTLVDNNWLELSLGVYPPPIEDLNTTYSSAPTLHLNPALTHNITQAHHAPSPLLILACLSSIWVLPYTLIDIDNDVTYLFFPRKCQWFFVQFLCRHYLIPET